MIWPRKWLLLYHDHLIIPSIISTDMIRAGRLVMKRSSILLSQVGEWTSWERVWSMRIPRSMSWRNRRNDLSCTDIVSQLIFRGLKSPEIQIIYTNSYTWCFIYNNISVNSVYSLIIIITDYYRNYLRTGAGTKWTCVGD